jgi:sec-independent protein translocase protein TatA
VTHHVSLKVNLRRGKKLSGDFSPPNTSRREAFYNESVVSEGDSMLRSIGPTELIVIIIVVVLLFGGKKIPELAKGLGEGIRHFKGAIKNEEEEAAEKEKKHV